MPKKRAGRPIDRSKDGAILRAARALLFTHGPQAVTMEAVAQRAGISKATLYTRHPDRYHLLRAVVARESFALSRSLEQAPRDLNELRAALVSFLTDLATFLVSKHHQRLMQAMALPASALARARQTIYRNGPQRTQRMLADYLEAAAAQGLIACPDPAHSAELLLGMMMGLNPLRLAFGTPTRHRRRAERASHAQLIVRAFLSLHAVQ
ncbi:TetR/AcrR family transcriptional regulator [Thiobacter aerophilum]|uniref:TetR/AcrR family transcriptional regulator n=1 Tax=Thiobacter aerophilum TaxID=3121275 RepID=A0ABV0EC81_9BURK